MPQLFCAFTSVPDPVTVHRGDSPSAYVTVKAPVHRQWSDSTIEDYTPGSEGITATSAYGGATFDNTADIYYLIAIKGSGIPVLLKEKDIDAADSVLGGSPSWAKWRRISNGLDMPCPQP